MKKFLIILFVFVAGCTTQKRCFEKFPPQIIQKDSIIIRDSVIRLHDTVYIFADTVTQFDTVFIKNGLVNSNRLFASTEFAESWSQVVNSKLILNLTQRDTAINRLLEANVQYKEVYKDRVEVVEKFKVHWYDIAARWIASIMLLLLLIRIAIKI